MTTPLHPIFEKRIHDATDIILRVQIEPWFFLNSGHPLRLKTFRGGDISYQNIGFEGSPSNVFWSGYIEPFLEDLVITQIAGAVTQARERGVDGKLLLIEVQELLLAACSKVFERMAEVDQRLRGNGYPQSVRRRPVDNENARMREFVEKHVQAELEMWRSKNGLEQWYERNKFWVWAIGLLGTVATIASKFM